MKHLVALTAGFIFAASLIGCTHRQDGFTFGGSPLRYKTVKFNDPDILAEVNGIKFKRDQILDKSPVIHDLDQQQTDAMIGLIYLKALKTKSTNSNLPDILDVYLKPSKPDIAWILDRFGRKPEKSLRIAFKKPIDKSTIAQLGDVAYTRQDIDFNNFVFQSIQERRIREITQQLGSQVTRILISQAAEKQKIKFQDFLKDQVFNGDVEVSDQELNNYLNQISFSASELTNPLKAKFIDALRSRKEMTLMQKYVEDNLLRQPIEVSFSPPRSQLHLDKNFQPVAGYNSAPISVVVFSSATCPECIRTVHTLEYAMKHYDGYLRLNWIHMADPKDGADNMVAEAALCAESLKPESTLSFLNSVDAPASQLNEADFYKWAAHEGLDKSKFEKCVVSKKFAKLIDEHRSYANSVGVVSDPSVWVDGSLIEGFVNKHTLDSVIDEKIADRHLSSFGAFVRHWRYVVGI